MTASLPPLSLYIHFPWCIRKCPYCDFNSHTLKQDLPEEAYIKALLNDLENELSYIQGREIISIFMGGGTPSLFSAASLAILLDKLKQKLPFSKTIEITLEANPGTVEQNRFKGFYQAGINRISLGMQSFQDEKLKALGRIHDANSAIAAAKAARLAGFTNYNIDLMFGLPNQSIDDALYDLSAAIELEPTHISWYQLTLEPNTLFYHRPPPLPTDDYIWDIQQQGQALLQRAGFQQYEISAYSQPGRQCLHNRNYWEFGDYIGIGAGAHGKITSHNHVIRTAKVKHPKTYLAGKDLYLAEKNIITPTDVRFEFMLNSLRLKQPISFELFERHTLHAINSIYSALKHAEQQGLIELGSAYFQTTEKGWRFLNNVAELFLPKSA